MAVRDTAPAMAQGVVAGRQAAAGPRTQVISLTTVHLETGTATTLATAVQGLIAKCHPACPQIQLTRPGGATTRIVVFLSRVQGKIGEPLPSIYFSVRAYAVYDEDRLAAHLRERSESPNA